MADGNLRPDREELKRCARCDLQKPLIDFRNNKAKPDSIRSYCRECRKAICREWYLRNIESERQRARDRIKVYGVADRERNKKWALENPARARHHSRKKLLSKKYNMTIEEHDELFAAQGFACGACGSPSPNSKKGWSTDHCHASEAVRGILCHHCNVGIGHAKDSVETLRRWIAYLERGSKPSNANPTNPGNARQRV